MFVINKECRAGIAEHLREDNVIDAVVTDPPYGLSKEPDTAEVLRHWLNGDDYKQTGGGFMGKAWDSFVPGPATWREVYRVLKPGGHALVFAGSRTQDLMSMALRLAGFEIRDTAMWLYGSGFPKSLAQQYCDVTSHMDWGGWGTALKPAYEPVIIARKPLVGTVADNVLQYGTGAINIDGCRIPGEGGAARKNESSQDNRYAESGATNYAMKPGPRGGDPSGRWPANILHDGALDGEEWARYFYCAKASKADRNAGLEAFDILSAGDATGGRDEGSAGLNNPRAGTGRTARTRLLNLLS